jgi:hypothetical protein
MRLAGVSFNDAVGGLHKNSFRAPPEEPLFRSVITWENREVPMDEGQCLQCSRRLKAIFPVLGCGNFRNVEGASLL